MLLCQVWKSISTAGSNSHNFLKSVICAGICGWHNAACIPFKKNTDMENVFLETKVLWSQIDANMHLRHSAYADFAAQARLDMLQYIGMTPDVLHQEKIGPILFREETFYQREVRPNDTIRVTCLLSKCREDGSRWSFVQEIIRSDDVVAARILVDGAWIDMVKRKLVAPPAEIAKKFLESVPRTTDFVLEHSVPSKPQENEQITGTI
jgi:acyl-CoA thioester hydrolase